MTPAVGGLVLLVGLGVVVVTAGLAALTLGARSTTWLLLAVYVLGVGEVLLLTQLLSLGHLVYGQSYLLAEAVLLGAAAWLWTRAGRPRPALPRPAWLRAEPLLLLLLAVVVVGVLYEGFIVLTTPPNNWDSMAYHLPRAAEWFQRHAVQYIPDANTERMNAFQPNAEMLILYTFALAHNDVLVELPQWLAQLAVLVAVYGIARRTGIRAPAALFAALLTATLTEFALESVTTQNDLVVASLAAAGAYFALGGRRADWALAGLALGAALGTKLTVSLALPPLALVLLAAGGWPRLVRVGAATALGFVAVGLYGFGLNLVETGKPLGDAPENTALQPHRTLAGTASTVARVTFNLVDLSGFSPNHERISRISSAGRWTFARLHIPDNPPESTLTGFQFVVNTASEEDNSYFGPLGFLLLLPLSVVVPILWLRRRVTAAQAALAAALPIYVVGIALAYRYNAWIGRFMLTPGALAMPTAALIWRFRLFAWGAAVIGAATLYVAHAHNDTKPAGKNGTVPVWRLNRGEAIAVRLPSMRKTLVGVDDVVPAHARILAVVGENDFIYALYGPHLTRRVLTVDPGELGFHPWRDLLRRADELGARWIIEDGKVPVEKSKRWQVVSFYDDNGWYLLKRVS